MAALLLLTLAGCGGPDEGAYLERAHLRDSMDSTDQDLLQTGYAWCTLPPKKRTVTVADAAGDSAWGVSYYMRGACPTTWSSYMVFDLADEYLC